MNTLRAYIALIGGTLLLAPLVLLAQLFRVPNRRGGIFDMAPRWWTRAILRASNVTIVRHAADHVSATQPYVYIANHVSWFDILALVEALPNVGFVAKREVERVPLFGSAARAVGVIYLDRENRQAAFDAYDDAAQRIREGASVAIYVEGTRGDSYPLRPFKKGPFVLAIRAGVPVVPVIIYGTIAINPRGSLSAQPGVVHVHLLDPVSTKGLTYEDRDELCAVVRARMVEALRDLYGVKPAPPGTVTGSVALQSLNATT